ncbi:MAG: cadherin-like domain-containing protein [Saprospiraceae bacterium]|nr:cadherin-like domain-containing protein [Saprospiraceae bacterium]
MSIISKLLLTLIIYSGTTESNFNRIPVKYNYECEETNSDINVKFNLCYNSFLPSGMSNNINLLSSAISATKQDFLVGTDIGPTGPSPGDILEYTIIITNSGSMDATATQFTDIIDVNTTLVPSSIQCSPIGISDSYNVFGNIAISVPAASGLLTNDLNPCGTGSLSVTAVNTTGTQGEVTFAANGSFTFNPASGFNGTTSFEYTVSNGTFTNTATVTLTVAGRIWFIDNNSPNGDGRLGTPFSSIANFNSGAAGGLVGDIIFLYRQTVINYTGAGLTLKNNQYLIGQGASSSIVALTSITLPFHSLALPATGGINPVIAHNATAVTLASNNKLHGFNVSNSGGTGIFGSSVGNLRIRDLSVANSAGTALNIASGILDVIIKKLDAAGATTGFRINSTTGSFLVEGTSTTDGTGGLVQNITQRGADIQDAINITLKNMNFTNANTADAGGAGVCDNEDNNLSCHGAIYLRNITTIVLNNLNVFNTKEQGLNGNNINGLTLTDSRFSNCGDEQFEGALKIRELHGTCSIDNCEFDDAAGVNVEIFNITAPNPMNLSVTNSIFRDNFDNPFGENGIFIRTENTGTHTVNIDECDFLRIRAQGVNIEPRAGTMNVNVTDCLFDKDTKKFMAGVHVIPTGSATANINLLRNTLDVAGGVGLMVSGSGNSVYQARINDNTIVGPALCSDCLTAGDMETPTCLCGGDGIIVWTTINSSGKAEVVGNDISGLDYSAFGIYASSRNMADLTLLIDNNDITLANDGAYGINFQAGNADASNTATICANVINNTVTFLATGGPWAGPTRGVFRIRSINTGSIANIQGVGATLADIWANNGNMPPSTATPNVVLSSVGTGGVINLNQSCPMTLTHPTALTAPQNELAVVPNQTSLVPIPATPEGTVAETISEEENPIQAVPMMDVVTVGPFTLPATKSITIKFRAMVNEPFPQGICQVINQGTVSGGNFSNVLTDDPDVEGASNPTITNLNITPSITVCPPSLNVNPTNNNCTSTQSFSATAVGCPTPTITYTIGVTPISSPYDFPTGTTTVNVTASNGVLPNATCSFTVTVAPPPTAFIVTGGGSRCDVDPGFVINLSNTQTGVNYYLFEGLDIVGAPIAGTGMAINFPAQSDTGNYSVVGIGPGGCATTMTGTAVIHVSMTPVSNAGTNQSICATGTATLDASASNGTGVWSVDSGPSLSLSQFSSTSSPTAIFTPASGSGIYILRWTVSNSPCADATDFVEIAVSAPPSGDAGMDQHICSNESATLNATTTLGTGTWSVLSGPSTSSSQFSNTSNGNSIFTPSAGPGFYVLNWAISTPGCSQITSTVTINVDPSNTIILSSPTGTDVQSVCINTPIINITYATTGATGATFSGLPEGVSGNWVDNVVTISGSPTTTVGSPFNYTVNLSGGCGSISATGTITVNPDNTITLTSLPSTTNQSVLINTAIANISYNITGASGATFDGLPSGVTGSLASNVITISGSPNTIAGSPFNYTVMLTGGCGNITATGTITVFDCSVTLTSAAGTNAQILCNNTPISDITYATTGATGANITGLPDGVSGSWSANVVTISGTPSEAGNFNYMVSLTGGGCDAFSTSGNITVSPIPDVEQPANQVVCNGASTAAVTFTGAVGGTIFNWTNDNNSIGLAASGTGNIPSFITTNTGTSPVVATITVTPTINSGGNFAPIPDVLYYKFDGTGSSVPNMASSPPVGTSTASILREVYLKEVQQFATVHLSVPEVLHLLTT